MAKLNLSTPWIEYYTKMRELFKKDSGVKIIYDDGSKRIDVYAVTQKKAAALERFLPEKKEFGGVEIFIDIIPPNEGTTSPFKTSADIPNIRDLFDGNLCVDKIVELEGWFEATYVIFHKEVVQYFDDNIGDINGNVSTLFESIAREVLEVPPGIFFCTNDKYYHTFVDSGVYSTYKGDPITF